MSSAIAGRVKEMERRQAARTLGERLPYMLIRGEDGVTRTFEGEEVDLAKYAARGIRPVVVVELTEERAAEMAAEREDAKAQRSRT